jgi:single-strand DNA-binding protein
MTDTNNFLALKQMNHVNLIGKVSSAPKIMELSNGRKIAKFTVATKEFYLDAEGNTKARRNWHVLTAWGKWVQVLEELAEVGHEIAVEGKLVSRFYKLNGERKFVSEVEVNDLILL